MQMSCDIRTPLQHGLLRSPGAGSVLLFLRPDASEPAHPDVLRAHTTSAPLHRRIRTPRC